MVAKVHLGSAEIERSLRNWEIARAQRLEHRSGDALPEVQEFITVSHLLGSGAYDVARRIGQRLDWPVYDRELLQAMVGDQSVGERLEAALDERDVGWVEGMLRYLLKGESRPHDYFPKLARTILALARGGNGIFIGRGADMILPQDHGLRVRMIAPLEHRVRVYSQREGVDEDQARRDIERIEHERGEFIRNHFGRSADDELRHDFVINLARIAPEQAVEMALSAVAARGLAK